MYKATFLLNVICRPTLVTILHENDCLSELKYPPETIDKQPKHNWIICELGGHFQIK